MSSLLFMDKYSASLTYISASISLLPLIVAIINYALLRSYHIPLFILLIASTLIELTAHILALFKLDVEFLYYIYTFIEFITISFFYSTFFRDHFKPFFIYIVLISYLLTCIFLLKIFGLRLANNYMLPIESFIFINYSLFFFFFILKNLIFENLLKSSLFWINTGILFYFSGNLCIFIFSNYIVHHLSTKYSLLYGITHISFNILMNVFFSIGFWKLRAK